MADPYVGEIRMFAGNYAPSGWAICDGSLLSISEYETLFALLNTTYGGDGQQTFGIPDLRGRVPVHRGALQQPGGSTYVLGQMLGVEKAPLTIANLPPHGHAVTSNGAEVTSGSPSQAFPGSGTVSAYSTVTSAFEQMSTAAVSQEGGGAPHDNLMPFIVINYIIATVGIFPQQS